MAEPLIIPYLCGNCRYGQTVQNDFKVVACHGLPPTPALLPGPQGVAVTMLRAHMDRAEPACALHKPKEKPPVLLAS